MFDYSRTEVRRESSTDSTSRPPGSADHSTPPQVLRLLLATIAHFAEAYRLDGFRLDAASTVLYRHRCLGLSPAHFCGARYEVASRCSPRDGREMAEERSSPRCEAFPAPRPHLLERGEETAAQDGPASPRQAFFGASSDVDEGPFYLLSRPSSSPPPSPPGARPAGGLTFVMLANLLAKRALQPPLLTVAEESSGYPGLCAPTHAWGAGFDYRMAMGIPDLWGRELALAHAPADAPLPVCEIADELTRARRKSGATAALPAASSWSRPGASLQVRREEARLRRVPRPVARRGPGARVSPDGRGHVRRHVGRRTAEPRRGTRRRAAQGLSAAHLRARGRRVPQLCRQRVWPPRVGRAPHRRQRPLLPPRAPPLALRSSSAPRGGVRGASLPRRQLCTGSSPTTPACATRSSSPLTERCTPPRRRCGGSPRRRRPAATSARTTPPSSSAFAAPAPSLASRPPQGGAALSTPEPVRVSL